MSFSANYPTSAPSFMLDFANSNTVDPRVIFTRASTATYFDSIGTLQSAAINAPRLDYNPSTLAAQGLLIEEQRTNSIRNNTMVGAAAGTPGTLPTNWVTLGAGLGTLTQQIVGTGTSAGITYIDVKISGTTSTTSFGIQFESYNQIAAATGQNWTSSIYVALIAGATTNLTVNHRVQERTALGVSLANTTVDITASLTSSLLNRFTNPRVFNQATTAFSTNDITLFFSSGAAIDITLRIGLPQLELGAFATSVIPTSTVAVTRSADVASVDTLTPWFNAVDGTFLTEFLVPQISRSARLLSTDDGTINNTIVPTINAANTVGISSINGGVYGGDVNSANSLASANVAYKAAFTFSTSTPETVCLNGGTVATGTITLPTPAQTRMRLGVQANGSATLNGYLRRISFYPRQLSNANLQALTS